MICHAVICKNNKNTSAISIQSNFGKEEEKKDNKMGGEKKRLTLDPSKNMRNPICCPDRPVHN